MKTIFFYINPKAVSDVWHKATIMVHTLNDLALELEAFKQMGYDVCISMSEVEAHPLAYRGF